MSDNQKADPAPMTEEGIDKEMAAIKAAWEVLRPLDHAGRYRVLDWLRMWANGERPGIGADDF